MESLFFELPIGLRMNGEAHKKVELLPTNGVAEKVFTKKVVGKPYTWQGNVISIAVKSIGSIPIGSECRNKFLTDGVVTIPNAVLALPLAEVNTLLLEIHRRCWESQIPKQEIICKYCSKRLVADIDLDKIDYSEEAKQKILMNTEYESLVVPLKHSFLPPAIKGLTDKPEYVGLTETEFNQFVFRIPTLMDAIKNERDVEDSLSFWRKIAKDCLLSINKVDAEGNVTDTLPKEFHTYYGSKIFDEYLSGKNLKLIREALTEWLPTLPFAYFEPCGCERMLDIPMTMDASSFFSE